MANDEYFEIVDDRGAIIDRALRSECHGNPALVHRVFHVLVFNGRGDLFLQRRAPDKDVQPDRWDTSVGGHLAIGEDHETAAVREMREELGVEPAWLRYLYFYTMRSEIETERVATFGTVCEGPFACDPHEISAARFWTADEIEGALGSGTFTPNFETEWSNWKEWAARHRLLPPDTVPQTMDIRDA